MTAGAGALQAVGVIVLALAVVAVPRRRSPLLVAGTTPRLGDRGAGPSPLPGRPGRAARSWMRRWAAVPTRSAVLAAVAVAAGATVLGGPYVGWSVLVVGAAVGHTVRQVVSERQESQALSDDVAACEALVAELRAGAGLGTALAASATGGSALATVLRRAASAVGVGGDPAAVPRSGVSPTGRRLGALLAVSSARGVAPAAAVDALRADLVHRREHRDRVDGLLAGPAASAALLAGLPVLGLLMGQGMGAEPFAVLTQTAAGGIALAVGSALAAVGLVWSRRIVSRARAAS